MAQTVISISSVFSQDIKTDSIKQEFKSYSEISYEYMVAPGYSYIWNIKNKVKLGVGFHIGFATSVIDEYRDFFLLKVYARDLFRKNKTTINKEKYDIGFCSSYSNFYEALFVGGLTSYYFYLSKRIKIGLSLYFGEFFNSDNESGIYFSLIPVIVYKFNKRK